ncbi:MAG: exosortase A [Janthinobacterium lividum]
MMAPESATTMDGNGHDSALAGRTTSGAAVQAPGRQFNLVKAMVFLLVVLSPMLIYFATARSMVAIWDSSETFAHGYIILPISLWLIWKRRAVLATMHPVPCWPAMLLLLACGFGWLLAELADVQVVRQYSFVAMLPLTVLAVLGWRITLTLLFPLLFLMLAVPFGEVFVDPLINYTADFTVLALQATGIPVLREGSNFSLPTGNWSVVEACSGLRYLIASITLGLLYAYLTYRSNLRRLVFFIMAIIVPIVANWLRAYMIVMIGHLSGMELATGVDHIIYGWLFFGVVMFLMFWIGSYWREDGSADEVTPFAVARGANPAMPVSNISFIGAALLAFLCMAVWPLYERYLDRIAGHAPAAVVSGFKAAWAPAPAPAFTDWKPAFFTPNASLQQTYQEQGRKVGLVLLYYRNPPLGRGLISSSNMIAMREHAAWRTTGSAGRTETVGARTLQLRETRVRGNSGALLVWDWYWIDGRYTANNYLGKLWQAKERLLMHGDDGASIQVYAPVDENPEVARTAMRAFLAANLDQVDATLAANRQR